MLVTSAWPLYAHLPPGREARRAAKKFKHSYFTSVGWYISGARWPSGSLVIRQRSPSRQGSCSAARILRFNEAPTCAQNLCSSCL